MHSVGRSRPVACRRFPGLDPLFLFLIVLVLVVFVEPFGVSYYLPPFLYMLFHRKRCFEGIEDCPGSDGSPFCHRFAARPIGGSVMALHSRYLLFLVAPFSALALGMFGETWS